MAWLMTPPTAPPAETRPHTMPVERRDTKGTTPYTDPHVPCTRQAGLVMFCSVGAARARATWQCQATSQPST